MRRYEKQIREQEKQLQSLQNHLTQKEKEAEEWKAKSTQAKAQWSQAAALVDQAKQKIQVVHSQWSKSRTLADAAEWSATERILLAKAADGQLAYLTRERFETQATRPPLPITMNDRMHDYFLQGLSQLSGRAQGEAQQAQVQETALRTEEMHWQTEEQHRNQDLDRLHQQQQAQWLKWQEATQRVAALEEEKDQMEQSAQALRVMVQELHEHRDHTLAARQERSSDDRALVALRGALPWPAYGHVTQNFGRQYASDLNQLLISNGIKISTGAGHTVRTIQAGKVLFSNPFHDYGQLVIVQHKNGLTSVYAGLGQTHVKEGDMLATLDSLGSTSESGSFYFELRRDEQPINPLVYLTPNPRSDLSSRRKFQ
jgi:septal ring factor EnvC (AmiA/AmiB activator)